MIPILRCKDMKESIAFYTEILDFELKYPNSSSEDWVVTLVNGEAEIQLTGLEQDQPLGLAVNVRVEDVDELFEKYLKRGLSTSNKEESPVHQRPLNQSWGVREFYVTDPNGNTLRFGKPIE